MINDGNMNPLSDSWWLATIVAMFTHGSRIKKGYQYFRWSKANGGFLGKGYRMSRINNYLVSFFPSACWSGGFSCLAIWSNPEEKDLYLTFNTTQTNGTTKFQPPSTVFNDKLVSLYQMRNYQLIHLPSKYQNLCIMLLPRVYSGWWFFTIPFRTYAGQIRSSPPKNGVNIFQKIWVATR